MSAALRSEARRSRRCPCKRFLTGSDSQVVLGALVKGRSSSKALSRLLKRAFQRTGPQQLQVCSVYWHCWQRCRWSYSRQGSSTADERCGWVGLRDRCRGLYWIGWGFGCKRHRRCKCCPIAYGQVALKRGSEEDKDSLLTTDAASTISPSSSSVLASSPMSSRSTSSSQSFAGSCSARLQSPSELADLSTNSSSPEQILNSCPFVLAELYTVAETFKDGKPGSPKATCCCSS